VLSPLTHIVTRLSCRGVVFTVLFHPKQLTLVSGGDDAEVRVWDLVDKSCIAVLKVRRRSNVYALYQCPATNCRPKRLWLLRVSDMRCLKPVCSAMRLTTSVHLVDLAFSHGSNMVDTVEMSRAKPQLDRQTHRATSAR